MSFGPNCARKNRAILYERKVQSFKSIQQLYNCDALNVSLFSIAVLRDDFRLVPKDTVALVGGPVLILTFIYQMFNVIIEILILFRLF